MKLDELEIPSAASNAGGSFEIIRVWVANAGQHVSIRTGVWEDPFAYGIMLCDLMRHIAVALHENDGMNYSEALVRIKSGFDAEYTSPTDIIT